MQIKADDKDNSTAEPKDSELSSEPGDYYLKRWINWIERRAGFLADYILGGRLRGERRY